MTSSLFKKLFFLTLATLISSAMSAQVIYVNQNASGANDGTSWANAYTDFGAAIDSSMAGNDIWVAAGIYKPGGMMPDTNSFFILKSDVSVYGGFAGTETDFSARDVNANPTILSGDIAGDDIAGNLTANKVDNVKHIFWISEGTTPTALLDGFTLSGGHAYNSPEGGNARRGGGILNYGACTVRNCIFEDNFGWFGGAMYPRFGDATGTRIEDCIFRNNGAGSGGAIYANSLDTFYVKNCEFIDNTSENNGGGVYNQAMDVVRYDDCIFTGNVSGVDDRAGAMYNTGSNTTVASCTFQSNVCNRTGGAISSTGDSTVVTIMNCDFSDNQSRWGGAMTNYGLDSRYLITDCTFERNIATESGGAISNGFKSIVEINNCDFSDNRAEDAIAGDGSGGAIFNQNDTTNLSVMNCDFVENTCLNNGGAFLTGANTPSRFTNCRFESNAGDFGGAIAFQADSSEISPLDIHNCVFAFNIAQNQGGAVNIGNADTRITNSVFDTNIANGNGVGGALSNNATTNQNSPLSIINSTFSGNIAILAAGIAQWTDTVNATAVMTLQNNIFSNPDGLNYAIEAGNPVITSTGGNLSSDASLAGYLTSTNDLNEMDPLFVDPTVSDFNLLENSPCVNAGLSANAPLTDILGNARIDSVDMGAYESSFSIVGTIDLEDNRALQISPNPVKTETQLFVENNWTGSLDIRITNTLGQVVSQFKLDKWQPVLRHDLNLEQLDTGIYQISVSNGKSMLVRSLIKH